MADSNKLARILNSPQARQISNSNPNGRDLLLTIAKQQIPTQFAQMQDTNTDNLNELYNFIEFNDNLRDRSNRGELSKQAIEHLSHNAYVPMGTNTEYLPGPSYGRYDPATKRVSIPGKTIKDIPEVVEDTLWHEGMHHALKDSGAYDYLDNLPKKGLGSDGGHQYIANEAANISLGRKQMPSNSGANYTYTFVPSEREIPPLKYAFDALTSERTKEQEAKARKQAFATKSNNREIPSTSIRSNRR